MKINKEMAQYFKSNNNAEYAKYFYGINISTKDIKDFQEYSKVTLKIEKGISISKISELEKISKSKIWHWIHGNNKPFIIKLLEYYLEIKKPRRNFKWISLNTTKGGIFTGPWIEVPQVIKNYKNLRHVIKQLKDAYKFPLFNPYVKSYRYQYMEKLFKAKRIYSHWPTWLKNKVDLNIKKGNKGTKLVKKILFEDKIAIGVKNINRRAKNLKQ